MLDFLLAVLAAVRVFLRSRTDTSMEVLALRQQVAVLKRRPPRPTLTRLDRFFLDLCFANIPTTVRIIRRCGLHGRRLKAFPLSNDVDDLIPHNKTRTANGDSARAEGNRLRLSVDPAAD